MPSTAAIKQANLSRGAGYGADLPADGAVQAEGLEAVENVGPRLAMVLEELLKGWAESCA